MLCENNIIVIMYKAMFLPMSAGLTLLDDIGLALSVVVLLFIAWFHFKPDQGRSWDRRLGAWLVIWLLLSYILNRMQVMFDWMLLDPDTVRDVWDPIRTVFTMGGSINYFLVHIFLMLLVPIPFLRKSWQLWAVLGAVVLVSALDRLFGDSTGPYHHASLLGVTLVMMGALVCATVAIRFLVMPPEAGATDDHSLAMRRSGYFAMGTICVVMDNMVFRTIGFFRGTANVWWTFPTVNWSIESEGYWASIISMFEHVFIVGAFAYCMLGFVLGGVFHLVQVGRKKHQAGLPTAFSIYMLVLFGLIVFRQWAYETEYATWNIFGTALDSNAELITALSDGFTYHLVYPTIALLHAVKFGLIEIKTEQDKKLLRLLTLGLMVAIAAVFTEVLQEIVPINDIAFAIVAGLLLATGWESKLIEALEPNEEMMRYSWKWPGNERQLILWVNIVVGVPFALSLLVGVVF